MYSVAILNYLIVNLINILLVRRFYKTFLNNTEKCITHQNIACIIFYAISTGVFLLYRQSHVNLITYIAGLFIISMFYDGTIKKKILVTLIIYAIFICNNVIIFAFSELFFNVSASCDLKSTISYLTITCLLNYLFVDYFCRKYNFYKLSNIQENDHIVMAIIPAALIYLNAEIGVSKANLDLILVISAISLIVMILLLYFLEKMTLQSETFKVNEDLTSKNEKIILQMKHDMLKELKLIQFLMSNERLECAQNKISEQVGTLEKVTLLIKTGNDELDFIFNMKQSEAMEADIKFECQFNMSSLLRKNYKDLSILIWNLLDNALEACAFVESKKWIKVLLDYQHGTLLIKIENSLNSEAIRIENETFRTTKEEGNAHGQGIKIVKRIVKDYNGEVEFNMSETQFDVNILLLI